MSSDERGYTLAELVLVMMIFSVVMALISVSFSNIVKSSSVIMKSAETDIGGLIGLELLRSDLEAAGMGLPWSLPDSVTYNETPLGEMVDQYPGTAAKLYNDIPPDHLPKAYEAGDQVGFNGSDYLVLKGTAVGMSRVSRRWGYLNYSSTGTLVRGSKSGMDLVPNKSDRAIVLKSAVNAGNASRELVTAAPGSSVFTLWFNNPLKDGFMPKSRLDSYLVYGVAPQKENDEDQPLMLTFPYNRADYYINPSDRGGNCAPNTGILYKTTIDQNGGATQYPLLDCVADLQVIFYTVDGDSRGELNTFQISPDPDHPYDAAYIREHLKEVRVYVLAQQGKVDAGYTLPMPDQSNAMSVGDRKWTAAEFLKKGWEHYHWKVYSIVVQPKNL